MWLLLVVGVHVVSILIGHLTFLRLLVNYRHYTKVLQRFTIRVSKKFLVTQFKSLWKNLKLTESVDRQ